VFEVLKLAVEADVNERNRLREDPSLCKFEFFSDGDTFSVIRDGRLRRRAVTFSLDRGHIIVKEENKVLLDVTVTLNDKSDCVFVVDGKERDSWHVRKAALESTFFDLAR
jgi:hypothetical protein